MLLIRSCFRAGEVATMVGRRPVRVPQSTPIRMLSARCTSKSQTLQSVVLDFEADDIGSRACPPLAKTVLGIRNICVIR